MKWEVWMNGYSDEQQFEGDVLPKRIGTAEAETYDGACQLVADEWNKTAPFGWDMKKTDREWGHASWSIWGIRIMCDKVE